MVGPTLGHLGFTRSGREVIVVVVVVVVSSGHGAWIRRGDGEGKGMEIGGESTEEGRNEERRLVSSIFYNRTSLS
jgi:hypothetical protein